MVEGDLNPSKAYVIISGRLGIVKRGRTDGIRKGSNLERAKSKLKSVVSIMGLMNSFKKKEMPSFKPKLAMVKNCLSLTNTQLDEVTTLTKIDISSPKSIDKRMNRIIQKFGKLLDVSVSGEIVGDVALIAEAPRSATVLAVEDSHLMVFSKEPFLAVKSTYTTEFMERKALLRAVFPSISMMPDCDRLNRIARLFKPVNYSLVLLCN